MHCNLWDNAGGCGRMFVFDLPVFGGQMPATEMSRVGL